jgi:hypothetical protein
MKRVFAVFLFATLSFAEDKKPVVKTPEISKDLMIRYYKAAAQQAQAQVVLDRAQKDFDAKSQTIQSLVVDITKECGDGFQPTLNGQGDLSCIEKPKPAEPVKK